MTLAHPTLDLWDEPTAGPSARVVADRSDRVAWLRARAHGVTGTDAARLSSDRAVEAVAVDKLLGRSFWGNAYTDHGRAREPHIARWVLERFGIAPSETLFHAAASRQHLATPDGIRVRGSRVELAEIKTTTTAWRGIPRACLRQVHWQQWVLGAERTLVVWEQHDGFVPLEPEPRWQWVDRDENEIHVLVRRAEAVLERLVRR